MKRLLKAYDHVMMLFLESLCLLFIIRPTKHVTASRTFITVPSSLQYGTIIQNYSSNSNDKNLIKLFHRDRWGQHNRFVTSFDVRDEIIFSLRAGGEENIVDTKSDEIGVISGSDLQSNTIDNKNPIDDNMNCSVHDISYEQTDNSINDDKINCNNVTEISDHTLPPLLPNDCYTSIFSHNNEIFGKGKYFTRKERIKNLLDTWGNDDTRISHCFDGNDDNESEPDSETEELYSLQTLIYQRAREYIDDINECKDKAVEKGKVSLLTHPKKVLHFIAPKIKAIRQSPEITLKITTARVRVDVRAAACALGVIGAITEYYACVVEEVELVQKIKPSIQSDVNAIFESIITDRRFEQLIECIQCSINIDTLLMNKDTGDRQMEDEPLSGEGEAVGEQDSFHSVTEIEDIEDTTEKINTIDASKTIWALSIFISHHNDIEQLGEIKCSQFVHALQMQSEYLLKKKWHHFRSGSNQRKFSSYADVNFVKEIHSLLKETVYLLWASQCAFEVFKDRYEPTLETCVSILSQNVQELWDSIQEQTNEEDDIIERLAEAEAEEEKKERDNSVALENQSDSKDSLSSCTSKSTYIPSRARFLFDYLSCRDVIVVLHALKRIDNDDENSFCSMFLSKKLQENVQMWLDHDLAKVLIIEKESELETLPDEIKLVDAASILSPVADQKLQGNQSRDFSNITSRSELALSINDLGNVLQILGITQIHKCFKLLLFYFGSHEVNSYLESDFLLQLLMDGSIHEDILLNSTISDKTTAMFYKKIASEIFARCNYDADFIVNSFSSSNLVSLVSSLFAISARLKLSKHKDVIDEKIVMDVINASLRHCVDTKEGEFSLTQLCRLATVLAQSQTLMESDISVETMGILGTIVAKISMEFSHWMEKSPVQSLTGNALPPVTFKDLYSFFSALTELNLYPYELCSALTMILKNHHSRSIIRNEELIECLYTGAKLRAVPECYLETSSHHLNKMISSILKRQKQTLRTVSFSPILFSRYVWALAIHGSSYSNQIPPFTWDELKRLPHNSTLQMLIGLTFACKTAMQSDVLSKLLMIMNEHLQHLNPDEVCSVAECTKVIKQKLKFDEIITDDKNEHRQALKDSINSIFTSIADRFHVDFSQFSIHQMMFLIQCYVDTTSMFGFIREKMDVAKKLQNETGNANLESEKVAINMKNRALRNAELLAFHHGWVRVKSIKASFYGNLQSTLTSDFP